MHTYTRAYTHSNVRIRARAYAYIYEVAACAGAAGPPCRSALRENTRLLPVVAGGYCLPASRMRGMAGHFDPIHAYIVSIMLTHYAFALARGRNAYHS